MADKQIIHYGMDLNQPLLVDDSLAIVLAQELALLAAIPPKKWSYEQFYFAQVRQPMLPSSLELLRLKDAPPKGPIIKLSKDVKLLPPKPNEILTGVKYDKLGQVICAKYTSGTTHPSIDGVRAHPSKVKFIPPKEAPKRAPPPQR